MIITIRNIGITIIISVAFHKVRVKSKIFPKAIMQDWIKLNSKTWEESLSSLDSLNGPYSSFVDSESAHKPRTLSLVGESIVSTAKTNLREGRQRYDR